MGVSQSRSNKARSFEALGSPNAPENGGSSNRKSQSGSGFRGTIFRNRSQLDDPIRDDEVLTHPALRDTYEVQPAKKLQGRGVASITATVKRKECGKLFLIKRVAKKLLPPEQWYTKPDASKGGDKEHMVVPLELVLLRSHGTGDYLPDLVEVHEDELYYYYVTQTHGIRRRKWRSPKTWLKPKYYPCDFEAYMRL
ncbi:hypothetical protein BC830DRAFT_1229434 [Chytriomyces sp. MP71]|nr:hypothetical protein BC830DRAFT_1229434 [Chytriomyces sp. MP71]